MKFSEGDYVKIREREVTPADVKSGMYYPFFAGLAGTVERVYENDEVSVKIDTSTLPQEILKRHLEIQESMKKKWLDGLSGEARNRLTADEKKFQLAYTLLVQASDLEPATAGEVEQATLKTAQPTIASKAVTSSDLDTAEEVYLKEREEAIKEE